MLISIGNIYVDHNILGVDAGPDFHMASGKDYLATGGERVLGGSSVNVALQLKSLGDNVALIAKTGVDESSRYVRDLLERWEIDTSLLTANPDLNTSVAINIVSTSGDFIGVHYGSAARDLTSEDLNLYSPLFSQASSVYFSGTIKQPALFDKAAQIFKDLSERGIKIFYDPNRHPAEKDLFNRPKLYQQLAHVEGYLPNKEELLQATDASSVDEALDVVMQTGVKFVAVKLGPKGCRVRTQDDDFEVEGHCIDPLTTVGAGDCFNATFISYYLHGKPLKDAAKYAVAASAIKVADNMWPSKKMIENSKFLKH